MEVYLWYAIVFGWLFVVGFAVGSFLNVVVYRLPRGKNLLWPSSRCGHCFMPIPLYHNVPLLSYWLLRPLQTCRARFSMRYFWLELLTGVLFAGLYLLEVGLNVQGYGVSRDGGFSWLASAQFPPHSWPLFAARAALASLLLSALVCLLDRGEMPRALVVTGALFGVAWALWYPWPSPSQAPSVGFQLWPASPLLPADEPLGGLVTALAGLLVVPWLVRAVGGRAMRPAAAVLAMTGAFLGWQPLLVAVALSGVVALAWRGGFAIVTTLSLVGVWLAWGYLGPALRPWLEQPTWALVAFAGVAGLLGGVRLRA